MKKPTFFLSSTIYDFKDLRSALKYFLEQQGCTVLASEFPDFKVNPDRHSYDSCLSAIEECDYFVLFIGSRIGGWYDPAAKISITQQEYRTAYALHRLGKLKVLAFVRSEIWELRENRAELRRFLANQDLRPEQKRAIENHPSKICEDADWVAAFVNEVARNNETKAALTGESDSFPTGNWLYTFSDFRQVIDAVQSHFLGIPVEQSAMQHLLATEIRRNLRQLLAKSGRVVGTPEVTVLKFYASHKIDKDTLLSQSFAVELGRWGLLSSFALHLTRTKLRHQVISAALTSSLLMDYDAVTGKIRSTPPLDALWELSEQIAKFEAALEANPQSVLFEVARVKGYREQSKVNVPTGKLLALLYVFDRWINIVKLSEALLAYLENRSFEFPVLRPESPVPDMDEEIAAERATDADVDAFLAR